MGVTFVAGFTATNKLYGAIEMAAVAYGYSMVTYMGQNYGAGRSDRIRKGYRSAILIAIVTGTVLGYGMILAGHAVTGAFLPGTSADVMRAKQIAFQYLFIVCSTLPILYVLHVTRSSLQGLGNTVMPMASGIAEFVMRTFMALVMTGVFGGVSIMYGEVVAWIGADLILAGALIKCFKRLPAESDVY
jgi:Na+-driven multidrug efflux pump